MLKTILVGVVVGLLLALATGDDPALWALGAAVLLVIWRELSALPRGRAP